MGKGILSVVARSVASIVFMALMLSAPLMAADVKPEVKAEKTIAQVPWTKVPGTERKVLSPLETDWNQLPGIQQQRLINSAKRYPKLLPIQQERFQERIKEWAALTPDQRKAAREKYKNMSTLPPAKQHELREKWGEKAQHSTSAPAQPPVADAPRDK